MKDSVVAVICSRIGIESHAVDDDFAALWNCSVSKDGRILLLGEGNKRSSGWFEKQIRNHDCEIISNDETLVSTCIVLLSLWLSLYIEPLLGHTQEGTRRVRLLKVDSFSPAVFLKPRFRSA